MRALMVSLLTVQLTAIAAATAAARAVGSPGYVNVSGDGNTLASIAADVADPKLFRLEGKRGICGGAFTLQGSLRMGPGEALVMGNPGEDWPRRLVYLLGGPMEFEDCAIEGAYWIHVAPEASGHWRNVSLISGANAESGYPLLYFESSAVEWDGGLLDAAPTAGVYTPYALFPRGGYYPGSVRNTIRGVTVRSRRGAIFDRADEKGHTVDLTFRNCRFEAEGPVLTSNINVADGERSRFTFEDCRWSKPSGAHASPATTPPPDSFQLTGSAAQAIVIAQGKQTVHRAPDLKHVGAGGAGDLGARLASEVPALGATLAKLGERDELRGSLYWPRFLLGRLERIRQHLTEAEWYGAADVTATDRLVASIRDMAGKLPLTLQPGSPYHPSPAPPPRSPATGVARVTRQGRNGIKVENYASTIYYDGGVDADHRARITEESTIRGERIFQAFPGLGGPSLRFATPTESAVMMWEQPWDVEVVQTDARIVGFKATIRQFERLGTAWTSIFFYDLPDVILFDVESIQRETPKPQPPRVRFQAYSDPARGAYNGVRFWNNDPAGVMQSFGTSATQRIFASDPLHGVFTTGPGEWYHPHLVKGMLVAQWNGYNDWRKNPPCGFIFRPEGVPQLYVNLANYFSEVVDLPPPPPDVLEPQRHRLLWFEGRGLQCWENIFNLEAAFNHPCRLEPVTLRAGAEPTVSVAESDSLARQFEIVTLPGAFNRIHTDRDVFRGDSTVFLLKDVAAGSRETLGTLPVRLTADGANRFRITSELQAPLAHVLVHLGVPPGARITSVHHGDKVISDFQQIGGEIVYAAEVVPGSTAVAVEVAP
jgi:hypothetical protein